MLRSYREQKRRITVVAPSIFFHSLHNYKPHVKQQQHGARASPDALESLVTPPLIAEEHPRLLQLAVASGERDSFIYGGGVGR